MTRVFRPDTMKYTDEELGLLARGMRSRRMDNSYLPDEFDWDLRILSGKLALEMYDVDYACGAVKLSGEQMMAREKIYDAILDLIKKHGKLGGLK